MMDPERQDPAAPGLIEIKACNRRATDHLYAME